VPRAKGHLSLEIFMANLLTTESLAELTAAQQGPCLSLYQPTHRHHPDNQQDPIRFRNLVKVLKHSLLQSHSARDSARLLEPFEKLAHDETFWMHTLDGLAVFSAAGLFRVFLLRRPVHEFAVVADSFHTKPLRRFLQTVDRYQILGLSLDRIQLFEGSRDTLDEIDPAAEVPRSMRDALGSELTDPHLAVGSYGGLGTGHSPKYHGHGGKKDGADSDARRYFRAIDSAVLEHHSRPSGLPLILAGLPEHHHLFREVSRNPLLVAAALDVFPAAIPKDELRMRAWQLLEPEYEKGLAELSEEFRSAKSRDRGSDDLTRIAESAATGRVATLLIESDRTQAGRLHNDTGQIERADLGDPTVDDVFDDLGALVESMGGRVVVMPAQHMPATTGVAAIYRH
jgi:hypothetical protein